MILHPICLILVRYALGGGDITSRDAALYINNVLVDTMEFPHLGLSAWNVWDYTDTAKVYLQSGNNKINLVSITSKGLANLDYFVVFGEGFTMSECVQSYSFSVKSNNSEYGTVEYSPIQYLLEITMLIN